ALAAALPELEYACGLATLQLLDGDVTGDSLVPVDGYLPVLGRAPVPDRVLEFESGDRAWVDRYERVLAKLSQQS
ncbi:MAG TPA: O-succinylbenzoate synthase, partial [Lentzea sp.]